MHHVLFVSCSRLVLSLVLAIGFLTSSGCSKEPKIVPVSGMVTLDGQPLTYGHIQILPAGWRPASGKLDGNGRFTLTTTNVNDGCPIGTHPVVILAGESITPEKTKWHAPSKYADASTSQLTVTITGPIDDLKIELTSDDSMNPSKSPPKEGGSEFAK